MVLPLIQLVRWIMAGSLQIPTHSFFRHKFGKFQYILDLCELMVSLTNPIVAFVLKLLAIIFLEASCHGDYPAGK